MTLVEGFDEDAVALARLLAHEGRDVTLAGAGTATPAALAVRELGVVIHERADLDADPGEHDEAFLDVWTPEVAPRVARLRAGGCRLRCLGDFVLERSPVPTIGITGTAGKTTTAAFSVELLRNAGCQVRASTTARAGNLWPTAELLEAPDTGITVMELTSSHLCFTTRSPTIAVVTAFWPDHLELHGSLDRYRSAKEAIVRRQGPADVVIANEDDTDAIAIASLSPGRRLGFSLTGAVQEGAYLDGDSLVVRAAGVERLLRPPPGLDHQRLQALLAALAVGVAVGAAPTVVESLPRPPFRAVEIGRLGGTTLVDDGLAATPAKTAAALRGYDADSVVLVAGGELASAGLSVHASPEEERLLERGVRGDRPRGPIRRARRTGGPATRAAPRGRTQPAGRELRRCDRTGRR